MHSCTRCAFECRTYKRLLLHYRFVHSHELGFTITCGVNGCQRIYSVVKSLLKHMKRNHHLFYNTNISKFRASQKDTDISENLTLVDYKEDDDEYTCNEATEDGEINAKSVETEVDLMKKSAVFMLSLREKCKLPLNSLPIIVEEFSDMICLQQSEMTQKLEKVMSSFNIEQDIKDEIKSVMKENSNVESAFISFDTRSKLNQYAIENMGMVEPTEYIFKQ